MKTLKKRAAAKTSTWVKESESISPAKLTSASAHSQLLEQWPEWVAAADQKGTSDWAAKAIEYVELAGAKLPSVQNSAEQLSELKLIAADSAGIALESSPLAHQLLRAELRIKLGVATSDFALTESGYLSLIEGLDTLLDGEGTPHKKHLSVFPQLVACWLRCLKIAKRKEIQPPKLNEAQSEALAQCRWLPLRLAQFSRTDGSAIFSSDRESIIDAELIKEGLQLWCDKADRRNAACLRTDILKPVPKPAVEKVARAVCGDWSGVCVFRSAPKPDAAYIAVALEDADFQIEFGAKGIPLACGPAKLALTRDGHILAPTGRWEEVCRHQEPEVEYWELERTFERGVWIQRQVAMSCKDEFAYVCDNIVADSPGDLTYRLKLPLAAGVTGLEAGETREITLCRDKMRAVVLPLAAEEWKTTPSYFEFQQEGGALRFDGRTRQSRMAIPWIVDLRAGKKIEDVTWRQLRVAEDLQNLPRDIAVAFRWQIGSQQWMAYRSLAAPSNRTVLGQNLISDFALARVFADGKTKNIVEIE